MLVPKHNISFQQNYVATVFLKSESLEDSKASQHTAEVGLPKQIKTKDSFLSQYKNSRNYQLKPLLGNSHGMTHNPWLKSQEKSKKLGRSITI